jgi:hypothetical protein
VTPDDQGRFSRAVLGSLRSFGERRFVRLYPVRRYDTEVFMLFPGYRAEVGGEGNDGVGRFTSPVKP